jgi:hypothetical protein
MKKIHFLSIALFLLFSVTATAQPVNSYEPIKNPKGWEMAWPEDPDAQRHLFWNLVFLKDNLSFATACDAGEHTVYKKLGNNKWMPSGAGLPNTGSLMICPKLIADKAGNLYVGLAAAFSHEKFGIYRSTDQGKTWTHMAFPDAEVRAFGYDETNNILYAAIQDGINNGTYKSTDEGVTWENIHAPVEDHVTALKVDTEGNLYIGSIGDGVYILNKKTQTWSQYKTQDVRGVNQIFIKDNVIYIAVAYSNNNSVYKSTDGGKNWTEVGDGLQDSWLQDIIMDNDGNLYVGYVFPSHGIYRLTKGSTHWELFNEGRAPDASKISGFFLDSANNTVYEIDAGQEDIRKYKPD